MRSWIEENGAGQLHQEGTVATMPPEVIIAGHPGLCGTRAARGSIRPSAEFSFELVDPARGRRIAHSYSIVSLPNVG